MSPPLIPDIDAFEERAAIAQYEGGLTRKQAEDLAALNRPQFAGGSKVSMDGAYGKKQQS